MTETRLRRQNHNVGQNNLRIELLGLIDGQEGPARTQRRAANEAAGIDQLEVTVNEPLPKNIWSRWLKESYAGATGDTKRLGG